MASIEAKLHAMGLQLPPPMQTPPGLRLPFEWVHVRGARAYLSGQVPLKSRPSKVTPQRGWSRSRTWGA